MKIYTIERENYIIVDGVSTKRNFLNAIKEFAEEIEKIQKGEGNYLLELNHKEYEDYCVTNDLEWCFSYNETARGYYFYLRLIK